MNPQHWGLWHFRISLHLGWCCLLGSTFLKRAKKSRCWKHNRAACLSSLHNRRNKHTLDKWFSSSWDVNFNVEIFQEPVHLFVGLMELNSADAEIIFETWLSKLQVYGTTKWYLEHNIIASCSEISSTMLGCKTSLGSTIFNYRTAFCKTLNQTGTG
jgi:hypothetical protein